MQRMTFGPGVALLSLASILALTSACSDGGRAGTGVFGPSTGATTLDPSGGDETGANDNDDGPSDNLDLPGGTEGGPPDCAETTVVATGVPPNVVLVLDYSSSMTSSLELFGDSRWSALWDAVAYATANYDERINFGALLFPDMSVEENNSCETLIVEIPVAPLNGASVMATIPPREHSPPGNTPTRAGLEIAAAHLATLDPETPQALILVTDGEALCGEGQWAELSDEAAAPYVGQLAAAGLPTYVIGMSNLGSSARAQLNDMAQQSGVPNPNGPELYYSADDLAQLQAAFDSVAGEVISCEIQLEFAPPLPDYLLVEVDGVERPYVEACVGMNGWTFVPDTDNEWIELCGSACADFQHNAAVHVVQACPPQG